MACRCTRDVSVFTSNLLRRGGGRPCAGVTSHWRLVRGSEVRRSGGAYWFSCSADACDGRAAAATTTVRTLGPRRVHQSLLRKTDGRRGAAPHSVKETVRGAALWSRAGHGRTAKYLDLDPCCCGRLPYLPWPWSRRLAFPFTSTRRGPVSCSGFFKQFTVSTRIL